MVVCFIDQGEIYPAVIAVKECNFAVLKVQKLVQSSGIRNSMVKFL